MLKNHHQLIYYKVIEKISPKLFEKYIIPLRTYRLDKKNRPLINNYINNLVSQKPFSLFVKLEIETINRCNNVCSFCPTNKLDDTRPFKLMEQSLFLSIIEQLKKIEYSGLINLFANNEPLLDNRIYEFYRITRETLPNAFLSLYTNGTLLTIEKFLKLMKYLDQLIIDNYNDKLTLINPVREVYNYCLENNLYNDKLKIYIRRQNEFLTTRGGQSKNRTKIRTPNSSCILPFDQMVVRPDGKLSLCGNDALGKMTLGDLTKEKIIDAWNNTAYWSIRKKLLDQERRGVSMCSACDFVNCL